MTAIICLALVNVATITAATVLLYFTMQANRNQLAAMITDHALERVRWAEERDTFANERRWLNDRMIARHAQDVMQMEHLANVRSANEKHSEDRTPHLVPEGL